MSRQQLTRREEALLVGLADGTLRGDRRASAELRLTRIMGGEDLLERQRRVANALRSGPAAPPTLGPAPRLLASAWPWPWSGRAGALGLAAVAAVALALLAFVLVKLPTGRSPSVLDVARLGHMPSTQPAPDSTPGQPAFVEAEFAGVRYPNWSAQFGWHTKGARSDRLGGRATKTVFYGHMGHLIGYTVVSGTPLRLPAGGMHVRRNGIDVMLYHSGPHHDAAVFVRNGHTCVLSGHVAHHSTLVKLAAWRGNGGVHFD
jgi:hypothetical protein